MTNDRITLTGRALLPIALSVGAAFALGCSGSTGEASAMGGTGASVGASEMGATLGQAGAPSAAGGGPGAGGTSPYANTGVCGQRGQSPVTLDTFAGYEEFYLIGEEGFGDDICVVRFEVARVGEAPAGCDDCAWTHLVEYSKPEVLTDVEGVCGNSELGMGSARIEEIDGSQAAYGFVYEYSGHVSVLMKYDGATSSWGPNGNATWSEEVGQLRFDRRDGFCGY